MDIITLAMANGYTDKKVSEGGGGAAIIDVVALPETDINDKAFYRVMSGSVMFGQNDTIYAVHCVDGLPETGEPATNLDNTVGNVYYNTQDEAAYGYVDATLAAALSVPAGWYPIGTLFTALGYGYGGVITDIADASTEQTFYVLLGYKMYTFKENWEGVKGKGWDGENATAEVFNTRKNVASGAYSHAEGSQTTASGAYSHAEGNQTTASGDDSHAEGYSTTASGDLSHAEGRYTTASGDLSHAEGSHTIATTNFQHVQGKFNIEDTEGKYAHIVGNGNSTTRSNAHTLDWDGNAWFAGGIELTSPNGTRYRFTVSDDGTLSAAVV